MSGKRTVRPLTSRERGAVLSTGLALAALILNLLPFFQDPISKLNEEGLLPAGIAYTAGIVLFGWLVLWAMSYLLRRAAASPNASRRFVLLMEP